MSYRVFAKTEIENPEDESSDESSDELSDELSDESEYEYPQSDEELEEALDERKTEELTEELTEEQALQLALSDSRQEEIQRKKAKDKAFEQAKETEAQALQVALHLSHQEELERQQIAQDPTRIEKVQDEFVELVWRQYGRMQTQQDYDIWPTFFRLIVCYDYSMFLDYIIPSIASFWKLRDYEIDQKYGLEIVQPKIIDFVWELRTTLIEFMKKYYSTPDQNMDLSEWPTSKVSMNSRHSWPGDLKPYEEKWNSLFEQEEIREHFKQKVFKESLFLVGALYHFFKYTHKS